MGITCKLCTGQFQNRPSPQANLPQANPEAFDFRKIFVKSPAMLPV